MFGRKTKILLERISDECHLIRKAINIPNRVNADLEIKWALTKVELAKQLQQVINTKGEWLRQERENSHNRFILLERKGKSNSAEAIEARVKRDFIDKILEEADDEKT